MFNCAVSRPRAFQFKTFNFSNLLFIFYLLCASDRIGAIIIFDVILFSQFKNYSIIIIVYLNTFTSDTNVVLLFCFIFFSPLFFRQHVFVKRHRFFEGSQWHCVHWRGTSKRALRSNSLMQSRWRSSVIFIVKKKNTLVYFLLMPTLYDTNKIILSLINIFPS